MTTPSTFAPSSFQDRSEARSAPLRWLSVLGAATVLAGCASTPLPVWQPSRPAPAPEETWSAQAMDRLLAAGQYGDWQ